MRQNESLDFVRANFSLIQNLDRVSLKTAEGFVKIAGIFDGLRDKEKTELVYKNDGSAMLLVNTQEPGSFICVRKTGGRFLFDDGINNSLIVSTEDEKVLKNLSEGEIRRRHLGSKN